MNLTRITLMAVALLLSALVGWGKQMTVNDYNQLAGDLTARIYPREDLAGKKCALVKVVTALKDVGFEGNLVGEPEYKLGEYWVYLTNNTRYLKIKHPDFDPLMVDFDNFSAGRPQTESTYELKLKAGAALQKVTFRLIPSDITLTVDMKEYPVTNGVAELMLSPEEHSYMAFAQGYQTYGSKFMVYEDIDNKITIALDRKSGHTPTPAPTSPTAPVPSQKNVEKFTVKGVTFEMVRVDGGSFMMGSDNGYKDEKPVHSETVGTFYIGKTEVTQALWTAVMGSNPSYHKGQSLPVEEVSWDDCQEFIDRLNRITGQNFRLPTEAEWEYAARGGNRSRGYEYSGSNNIESVGWHDGNSGNSTHPVGNKLDNELGLYDMSGNVREWTSDLWSSDYSSYRNGGSSGSYRVSRGGSYNYYAKNCRSANRGLNDSSYRYRSLGFRLAL